MEHSAHVDVLATTNAVPEFGDAGAHFGPEQRVIDPVGIERGQAGRQHEGGAPERVSARPRRVLIIVENLPAPFDRRVWQEARTLTAAGYRVSIICPKAKGYDQSFEEIDGIAIYRHRLPLEASGCIGYLAEYGWALFSQFYLSIRVLLERGFDVIHACNPPDNIFIIGRLYKLLGKKFIFDHHDLGPELYEAKFQRKDAFYRLMLTLERWTFSAADVSIATNESYRNIAIARGKMKPERVFVVRSGPDLNRFKVVPPDPGHKHGRRFLVGYVGVMGHQEGIDLLLESVRHIVHDVRREDIHFTVVGSGTELPGMQHLAVRLGVAPYVTFTGRIPDSEMLPILSAADLCVNPDIANEMNDKSTMNKIVEYMALGKPIVQYDLTEGRISAGEASLYARKNDPVDFADKIVALLDDPALRARMGDFGRNRVIDTLSWDHEVPHLLAAYSAAFR